jgi:hypothetical protein
VAESGRAGSSGAKIPDIAGIWQTKGPSPLNLAQVIESLAESSQDMLGVAVAITQQLFLESTRSSAVHNLDKPAFYAAAVVTRASIAD